MPRANVTTQAAPVLLDIRGHEVLVDADVSETLDALYAEGWSLYVETSHRDRHVVLRRRDRAKGSGSIQLARFVLRCNVRQSARYLVGWWDMRREALGVVENAARVAWASQIHAISASTPCGHIECR